MLDWIKHDMKGDPKEIIDRLDRVIHGSVAPRLTASAWTSLHQIPAFDKKLNRTMPCDKNFITGRFLLMAHFWNL